MRTRPLSEAVEDALTKQRLTLVMEIDVLSLFDTTTFLDLMTKELHEWGEASPAEKRLCQRIEAQVKAFEEILRAIMLAQPQVQVGLEVYADGFADRGAIRRMLQEVSRTNPGQAGDAGPSEPPPAHPGGETRTE